MNCTVFLGEDNSVKLGDFGLSKVMASHDFASTYVGTPFYMSPEICAAERYTLKSDIWSLGCIMYELCAKEPPFNAKSHIELVQRIRDGRIAPLPPCYSPDVTAVIKDCLKVNPDRRPDTATLLNLPIVKLMRKEKEVVEVRKLLAQKETELAKRVQEAEDRHRRLDAEKAQMRQEIDASVRREWEVKATLEIERQVEMRVQAEMNRLRHRFDIEVKQQVEEGIQKFIERQTQATTTPELYSNEDKLDPSSSVGTSGDGDSTSTTELTELSALSIRDSPAPTRRFEPGTRTPFSRAQTMHAAPPTPMDIEMGEPSPAPSMDALALSPRRKALGKAPAAQRNDIFARAVLNHAVESEETLKDLEASDDDDDHPLELSPTRPQPARSNPKNPFKPAGGRPALISQKTAPLHKLPANGVVSNPSNVFHLNQNGNSNKIAPTMAAKQLPTLRPAQSNLNLRERERSPAASPRHRRASKIPSSNALNTAFNAASESPSRKTSATSAKKVSHSSRPMSMPVAPRSASADGDFGVTENVDHNGDPIKTYLKSRPATGSTAAGVKGRTLVELSQARAGGRPIDPFGEDYMASPNTKRYNQAAKMQAKAAKEEKEAKQAKEAKEEPKEDPFAPAVWDPEVMGDDMPSPFVVRTRGRGGLSR